MEHITFHCKVITPMFLAGADGQTPELRAPSIKGAMRFWWRAMNGHLVEKDEKTGKWDYSELKKREGEIFGDTSSRSNFSIQLRWEKLLEGQLPLPETGIQVGDFNNDIFKFMTYGLWDHKNAANNRNYIGPESKFTCKLQIGDSEQKDEILRSFYCLINFGGIGAKVRNGFGSIAVNEVDNLNSFSVNPESFKEDKRNFSCFSSDSYVHKICTEKQWSTALAKILLNYVDHKNKFDKGDKNLLAAHNPKILGLERKPKFCFYKVNENTNGTFTGSVIFLPYALPKQEPQHSSVLKSFMNKTINP